MIKPTQAKTVTQHLASIEAPRRKEMKTLHAFIKKNVATLKPYLQGAMIGYGKYHYRYATGREGDWAIIALASQKALGKVIKEGAHVMSKSKAAMD